MDEKETINEIVIKRAKDEGAVFNENLARKRMRIVFKPPGRGYRGAYFTEGNRLAGIGIGVVLISAGLGILLEFLLTMDYLVPLLGSVAWKFGLPQLPDAVFVSSIFVFCGGMICLGLYVWKKAFSSRKPKKILSI